MKTTTRRTALFGPYALDVRSGELRKFGTKVKMGEQAFQILCLLLERPGEMVIREELRAKLWADDTFVDFDHGLNSAVQRLRDCLSDSAEKPRWIETVPRRGYRFVGQLEWSDGSASSEILPQTSGESQNRNSDGEGEAQASGSVGISERLDRVKGHGGRIALLVVVALLLFLVAIPLVRRIQGRSSARQALLIRSLAVLPLENLSGDPAQEYFADGMTDEVITMLAKNTGLRVVSRTSVMQYKKVHRPLADVARELGVDGILEGSVGRSGNRVHINAQLIYAPKDMHLWAESYDRDLNDLTSLQSDLAQNIARQVGMTTAAVGRPERHINPEAHDAYLLGRHYWFVSQYKKSREYFQKAIDLQPDYAAAWSGVADYYTASAVEGQITQEVAIAQAEPAARKAIELDDSLADAHHAMAAVYYFLRWDWNAAEKESARAIELNPHYSEIHHLRSYLFDTLSRTDESLQEERKAMELDPFARPFALALALLYAHQFDAALQEALARSEVQHNDATLVWIAGDVYVYKGMQAEGVQEWERALLLWGDKKSGAEMQRAFRRGGFRAVLEWNLSEVQRTATTKYVSPMEFAFCYARLGRKDETIRYLERAYQERTPFLVHLPHDPNFYFVHSDARYRAIINKMGLPPA